MNTWCFLGYPVVSSNAPFIGWCCRKSSHSSHSVCKTVDFYSVSILDQTWTTHGIEKTESSLLTNFGFTSKNLNLDNQHVEEEAGSAAAAEVRAGPMSE